MIDVKVIMKNGEAHEFKHKGRAGGSYGILVRYEGAFVIISDEWGNESSFPAQDVGKVEKTQLRHW